MAQNPDFQANAKNTVTSFYDGFGDRPRVIFEAGAPVAYSPTDPTVARTGGSRIHQLVITSNTAATNITATLHRVQARTQVGNMGTASFATNNTITRTTGSFITDGWAVGERFFVAPGEGNGSRTVTPANGQIVTITTVTATTLTVSGTPFAGTPEALPAGFALWLVSTLGTVAVPANSGTGNIPAVSMLQPAAMPFLDESPNRFITLGTNEALAVNVSPALAASVWLNITAMGGNY